eukprot:536953-Rhodomonas_salina.1
MRGPGGGVYEAEDQEAVEPRRERPRDAQVRPPYDRAYAPTPSLAHPPYVPTFSLAHRLYPPMCLPAEKRREDGVSKDIRAAYERQMKGGEGPDVVDVGPGGEMERRWREGHGEEFRVTRGEGERGEYKEEEERPREERARPREEEREREEEPARQRE